MTRAKRKPYDPAVVEEKIYRRWERAHAFRPASDFDSGAARGSARPPEPRGRRRRRPFVVLIPLPNITGSLHMGHALQHTLMDCMTRYHRMRGDDALLVPGTDHAGIATQNVVEKELRKEGTTRRDMGRERFIERVWAWKERYGAIIDTQMRRLGDSCDWSRYRFTMDPDYVRVVQDAFIHYAQKGLIYRGDRIVNWCPRCASSISDLEVTYEEREGTLYVIRYPRVGRSEFLRVATTRPETMLGDTGVAVHPDDERYTAVVGAQVMVPLANRAIPVVADRAVDAAFGTGVVKVTPAHDHTDAEIGARHALPVVNAIGEDGRMTDEVPGPYRGLALGDARAKILEDLRSQGLLEREEPYRHRVSLCGRCGAGVQPLISKQWFVKMQPLAGPAIDAVEGTVVTFTPERWKATVLDWLKNVRDWCISRQLWWGHRLPVWYCQTGRQPATGNGEPGDTHVVFSIAKPKRCLECGGADFVQDPDVLDTWFSSALWPFAVFGWPEATDDLARFYPTSVLTTAPDILSLWVARMMFSGLEFMNGKRYLPAKRYGKTGAAQQVPFREVLVHQTVLNVRGQRMSKSLGTGVDPMDLIDRYGADAVRFGLLLQSHRDQQALRFDENAVRAGRNFANKLWNIARFLETAAGGGRRRGRKGRRAGDTPFDRWILARCAAAIRDVTEALDTHRYGDAMRALHAFVWDEYADWYIEVSKVEGMASPRVARDVFRTILHLLHPFLPFITEEMWSKRDRASFLMCARWPARPAPVPKAPAAVSAFQAVVNDLRSLRALLGMPASAQPAVRLSGAGLLRRFFPAIQRLTKHGKITVGGGGTEWIPVPASSSVSVAYPRAVLSALPLAGQVRRLERECEKTDHAVARMERRVARMSGKAPRDVADARRAALREKRDQRKRQRAALAAVRALARKVGAA